MASKKGTKMKDKILTKILAISFILVIVTSCIVPCIAVDNSANNVPNLSDVNNAPSLDKSLPDYLRIGKEGYYPSVPERSIIEITSEEAKAMLQADPNVILLDVRTPTEFSSEHIRGARCVPLSDLKAHISALDRSSGIVIYSDSGVESEEACEILTENGFRRVYNLLGGIEAWKGAGGEVSGSGEAKFEGGITHATYPKSKTCFYKGFSAENISYENITGANLQITSSDEQKLVEGLSVSESGQKTTITFEDLVEGQVVGKYYQGLTFSLPWRCGDGATGYYNIEGYPPHSWSKCVWTGLGANSGTITFDTPVSSVAAWFSAYLGVTMEGYDADGNLVASGSLGQVDGYSAPITLAPAEGLIKYVIVHDTANYWTMDDLSYVSSNIPVVLVHGFSSNNKTWSTFEGWLKEDGIERYYSVPLDPCGDIYENANFLACHIRWVKTKYHVDKVNIVAHSMGGLVSRFYVTDHSDVENLIMIGTPNDGSVWAYIGMWTPPWCWCLPAIKELTPKWIHKNYNKRVPYPNPNVKYYAVAGKLFGLPGDGIVSVSSVKKCPNLTFLGSVNCFHTAETRNRAIYEMIRPLLGYKAPKGQSSIKSTQHLLSNNLTDTQETPPIVGIINQNETVAKTITIDQAANATFINYWLEGDLDMTLTTPDGKIIDPSVAANESSINYTDFRVDPIVKYTYYTVENPLSGDWITTINATNVSINGTNYVMQALLQSNLTMAVSTNKDWYQPNETIEITATILDNSVPIIGAKVTAEIRNPDYALNTISLFDDGLHNDSQANDGVYSNIYTNASLGGYYDISVTADGVNLKGNNFSRRVVDAFIVSSGAAELTDNYSDHGTDTDGDGLYNYLTLDTEVNVTTAGNFTLNGGLYDGEGDEITWVSNLTSLHSGIQTIQLNFDGFAIGEHRKNGPYAVKTLFLFDENGTQVGYKDDAYTTSLYNYTDFQRSSVVFVNYSDYGTDTDGNGLYDYLTVDVEVIVANAGDYVMNARLLDKNENELILASNTSYLYANQQQIMQLNFDGRYVYGSLSNGSFYVRDLYVYNIANLIQSDLIHDAYTTSAYNYTDFEKVGVVIGRVTDKNDISVSNAFVSVTDVADYDYTNETGNYSLTVIQNGTYTITASPPPGVNLAPNSTTVYVTVGQISVADIILHDGGILTGNVTDTNGLPVRTAYVTAQGPAFGYAYTDTNGTYTILGLENGTYNITVTPPPEENLVGDSASVYVTVGETTFCNFTLKKGGIIAGRVTDVNGTGIANARVEASDITHTILKSDLTNSSGCYSIKGLPNNTYIVTAYPPYGTNLVSNSTTVTVTHGQTTFANFTLKEGGIITGKVTYENGTGIPNVEVEASGPSDGWTFTNTTGNYTIYGLEAGTYTVTAYAPYGSGLVDNSTTATVTAGETTVVHLILHHPAAVTGRITDENGTGIYNAQVSISGPTWESTYTDYNGYYTITGLEEGNYHLSASPPSGTNLVGNSTSIYIKAGQTTTVNLILEEGGILAGRVTDINGTPIYNARVSVSGPSWGSDYTDSCGYYEIVGLQTGTYRIETHGQTGTNLVNVTCAEITQKETTTLNIVLHEGGMIIGRVTDEYGVGVSNAYARAPGPIYVSANTDSAGYYTIEGLINGTYIVTAEGSYGSNLLSNPTGADVNEGETIEINFTLRTGGIISGRVADENGLPIAYVDVNTFSTYGYGSSVWAYTDYNGYYTITGLQSGEYTVTAYGYWYGLVDNSTTASVQLGATTTVNFILSSQEGGTLTGEVMYEDGTAAPFVDVSASGKSWGYDETDSNGHYTITGLQEDEYTVIASEPSTNLVNSTTAHVTSGETTTANLTLHEGGIVKGRVTDVNGTGLANAWVSIFTSASLGYYRYGYGYYNSNQTNSTGYYVISGIPNGTYNISASSYGYCGHENLADNSSIITTTLGQTTTYNFILQNGGSLKGRVTTQDAIPIAGAFISAEGPGYGYTYTTTDGNYTITRLRAGTYEVMAYPPSGAGLAGNSTSADVSAGQTTSNVDIILLYSPLRIHANTNKSVYERNDTVEIFCIVQNETGVNISVEISGSVKNLDGPSEKLAFKTIATGNYNASYTNTTINGTYYVTIYANRTGYKNATKELSFQVGSSSPCFIATAAYGTPLHEDIDVLRDFRDEYLMTNPIGRTFVKIYYTTSPPIADAIRENERLRTIVREGLVKPLVYISRGFVG